MLVLTSIGGGCLLLTAVWKGIVIKREMRRGEESQSSSASLEVNLIEASSLWVYGGVLTTTYNSVICIVMAVTLDEYYRTLCNITLPIVVLIYVESLFCQPRRR